MWYIFDGKVYTNDEWCNDGIHSMWDDSTSSKQDECYMIRMKQPT